MSTAASPLKEIAAQWRTARRLYLVYSALLERYALGLPPCRELESPVDRAEPEVIKRVWNWFAQMDERVHVHQLRQLLQTSRLGNEDNLRVMIQHQLDKENKTDADRDKIDFLLVQYLSSCAPAGFYDREVGFGEIAEILKPLLGEVGSSAPAWLKPLEGAIKSLDELNSLRDLLENGTLEKMRKLKAGGGEKYFAPTALVAITRFNFLVRRTFVRLIAADLHAIRSALHELETRGVKTVDCSRAQLSNRESLDHLKHLCQEWKKPFRAAYAAGQNFRELVEIRTIVEDALALPAQLEAALDSPAMEETAAPSAAAVSDDADEDVATIWKKAQESMQRPAEERPVELARETPASIAAQLFQGASSTGVTWEAVDEDSEPEAEKRSAPPASAPSAAEEDKATLDVQQMVESITEQLTANSVKAGSVATITASDLKLLLSSWEVGAFIVAGEEGGDALQRIVAARAILLQQIERRKRRAKSVQVKEAVSLAQGEISRIQAKITAAKQAKKIDAAVNMSASCKRLQTLIAQANKPGS